MLTAFEFQETKNGKCSLTLPLYSITLQRNRTCRKHGTWCSCLTLFSHPPLCSTTGLTLFTHFPLCSAASLIPCWPRRQLQVPNTVNNMAVVCLNTAFIFWTNDCVINLSMQMPAVQKLCPSWQVVCDATRPCYWRQKVSRMCVVGWLVG